jgi:uncharacterized repeat protein (TIGR03803 family)
LCCADGQRPTVGSLVDDGSGQFYGLTYAGGANGKGTVYAFDSNRPGLNVLYSSCSQPNCTDGWGRLPGLTILPDGSLVARSPMAAPTPPAGVFQP